MKNYQPATPRKLFAATAIAMTALTIAALVVAPAHFDGVDSEALTLARNTQVVPNATEVAISPARIEVIALREQKNAFERFRAFLDKRKQAG